MNKRFTALMTTLILSVLFSISASAGVVEVDGIYYDITGTTATVTSGDNKYSGDIVIPESITYNNSKYSVTSIGECAFRFCSGLTSITIPNSVTSIRYSAFEGCSGLISVTIPNSVTSIEDFSFSECSGLTSVEIPNSVTSIRRYAFSGCIGLTSVTIPNSVTSIGEAAFSGCSGLTSVTIPNSVTSIGRSAFEGCSGLTSVTIPNSVTSIGDYAFSECSGLTSVTIPNSVTSIGDLAFYGCTGITQTIIVNDMFVFLPKGYEGHYSIPENISTIIGGAFEECRGLTSVTIPNSVTSIRCSAFEGCSGLTSVTIPNSVTRIGDYAFEECSGLTSVTIPNSVTSIGHSAFRDCTSLTSITIPNSVTRIEFDTFYGCSGLTSITIPNSVTSIGSSAFIGCSSLTSITIPNSVTSIHDEAFEKCSNIENVYCYAEEVPSTSVYAFYNSDIEKATLHVPASAIEAYKTTAPWSRFGTIKTLEGTDGETKKCETPTISFVDGKLTFSCATEGVEYASEVTCSDVNKYYSNEINLAACYDITVTAMKTGYDNSDVATAKLYWLTSSGSLEGDNINNVSMRGIAIQSAGGFVTISGLDNNETVSFYGIDGKALGSATAINGTTTFAAQSGSVVVAKIGKENIKIAVK